MFKTDLEPSSARIYRLMIWLAAFGTTSAGYAGGWPSAIGFLTGALFSGVNFWLWHRVVRRVGESAGVSALTSAGRYIVFVLVGYAIVKYFEASVLAALIGCFVAVAAVLLEILLELFYGT